MTSTAREYFHTIYAASDDPWNFATSSYEQRKYALTLDSLRNEHYRNAFDAESLGDIVSLVVRSTEPGSHVVGVHWRGDTDYPLTGDGAHEVINAHLKLRRMVHHLEKEFVIDLWERVE